jgi:hypothetical protein
MLLSTVSAAEVQQATGKILLYKILRYEFKLVTILIVNDNIVYTEPIEGLVSYDPTSNVLTIEWSDSCYYESDIQEAAIFGYAFPASYVTSLPNLQGVTVKCIDIRNNVTKTVTVDFAELGITVKQTNYEGYNAVEINVSSDSFGPLRVIYREDGILLFAKWGDDQIKLMVEDDIAKKTGGQPTQPSTPSTATNAPSTTTTSTPSPTPTTTTHAPVTTAQTSTQPQTTTQPAATTPAITPEKTQGVNTMYVAVVAIAVIGLVVAAIMLKKR